MSFLAVDPKLLNLYEKAIFIDELYEGELPMGELSVGELSLGDLSVHALRHLAKGCSKQL